MDITSYNILLKACCSAKRFDLAQDMYMEIKRMASKGALKMDVITYTTMIKAFTEAKLWQMAFNVKDDMLLAAVSPNVVTWSALIGACANAGLLDRAIQMFNEMLMAGCEPNTRCCNSLLYACVKSCQYDRAFRFYYAWKETGFKILHIGEEKDRGSAYDSLNGKCQTEHDSSQSLTTIYGLQHSRVNKVVPFKPTVATFNILMKACGTDYHRAKAVMAEIKAAGLSPNHISWCVLIDIYGTSQNMKGAMKAFRGMRDIGIKLDVVAYTTAIKACVENKNLKMAFRLFEEMKRDRVQPNWVTYNTLLRARRRYGSLHEVQQCLAIYQDMQKAGYSSNDYYLKELLEEWCEEVICSSNRDKAITSINKTHKMFYSKKPHSLLLEKVARNLQKDVGDNQAIDIRGLTKVEARIVVLSVLWRIRESYSLGKMVEEDMIIISGVGKEVEGESDLELEVQLAIIKVLQDELGLDVMIGYGTTTSSPDDAGDTASFQKNESPNTASRQKIKPPNNYKHIARRPEDLGVLKVSKKSLRQWLQKREGIRN